MNEAYDAYYEASNANDANYAEHLEKTGQLTPVEQIDIQGYPTIQELDRWAFLFT